MHIFKLSNSHPQEKDFKANKSLQSTPNTSLANNLAISIKITNVHNPRQICGGLIKCKLQCPSLAQAPFEALGRVPTIFQHVMFVFENFAK